MNLAKDVDLEDCLLIFFFISFDLFASFIRFSLAVIARPDKISGADIAAICQEAGMQAIRHNRYVVLTKDFERAYKSVVTKTDTDFQFYK